MTAVLTLSHACFAYDEGTSFEHEALADISLEVAPGSYTFVMGHTGSGKSTLLRIMAGLVIPTSGSAGLARDTPFAVDQAWGSARPKGASLVSLGANSAPIEPGAAGLVFQDPEAQLFAQTVFEDVAFGPMNLGLAPSPEEQEAVVRDALAAVGLDFEGFRARSPFTLSGGEARRVAIAGILAMQPLFMLFDEPTAGLDDAGRAFVHALIERLVAQGVGVVVVSHDIDSFLPRAQRVLVLEKGRIAWLGAAHELIANPRPLKRVGFPVPPLIALQQHLGAMPGTYSYDPQRVAAWALAGHPVEGCGERHTHTHTQGAQGDDPAASSQPDATRRRRRTFDSPGPLRHIPTIEGG
ncbi:MAG: ATP-binding cassette domain-containing protein [Coriobacteriales bacterium]|jgi:energy-coupling factor transport system ATP-binding protein|nr:ATP-binding cassette domain-containing protein [Coriobacteriales bacterium]